MNGVAEGTVDRSEETSEVSDHRSSVPRETSEVSD